MVTIYVFGIMIYDLMLNKFGWTVIYQKTWAVDNQKGRNILIKSHSSIREIGMNLDELYVIHI